jgi:hypothetical protein
MGLERIGVIFLLGLEQARRDNRFEKQSIRQQKVLPSRSCIDSSAEQHSKTQQTRPREISTTLHKQ